MATQFSSSLFSDGKYEVIAWKKNYFMNTENIYEERGPKYKCEKCKETFNTRLSILTHSQVHLKPFCVVCYIYTVDQRSMYDHMKCLHPHLIDIQRSQQSSPEINIRIEEQNVLPIIDEGKSEKTNFECINDPLNLSNNAKDSFKEKCKQALTSHKKYRNNRTNKKSHISNSDLRPTKSVVSRFGRCINVKVPEF